MPGVWEAPETGDEITDAGGTLVVGDSIGPTGVAGLCEALGAPGATEPCGEFEAAGVGEAGAGVEALGVLVAGAGLPAGAEGVKAAAEILVLPEVSGACERPGVVPVEGLAL